MSAEFAPSCSRETWLARGKLLRKVREFFEARNVLEVETPSLSFASGTDPNLDYFETEAPKFYLPTSPEFHLKRLLAAGFGDVFSVARAFRKGEFGSKHNSEFTMVEWYRLGFSMERLMCEVEELCSEILGRQVEARRTTYAEAFEKYAGISAYSEAEAEWKRCCTAHGVPLFEAAEFRPEEWRDYVMSEVVEKALDMENGEFIYDYPEAQAALAKTEVGGDGRTVGKRFELYLGGYELCNGYQELTDVEEQVRRFLEDLEIRERLGKPKPQIDTRFLAALRSGMPECSGVALGLDRLFMLALGKKDIREVLLFPSDLA